MVKLAGIIATLISILTAAAAFSIDGERRYLLLAAAACIYAVGSFLLGTGEKTETERLAALPLRKVDKMNGREFEEYLCAVLELNGYQCETTQDSNDYGADIIAKRGRLRCVVQAKRYKGKVGIKAVQEIVGAMNYYGATHGAVITNSTFTSQAEALAEKAGISLYDREDLAKKRKIKL